MESNSDKQLRDKLTGNEFPFDPQAWEKMEALLGEKKKRRGIFWWWFSGGIAAGIAITLSLGYGLLLMGDEDRYAENNPQSNKHRISPENESSGKSVISYPQAGNSVAATENKSSGAYQTEAERTNELLSLADKEKNKANKKNSGEAGSSAQPTSIGNGQFSSPADKTNQEQNNRKIQREKRKDELLKKAQRGAPNTTIVPFNENEAMSETIASNVVTNYPAFGSNVSTASLPSSANTAELLQMDKRFAFLQAKEDELSFSDETSENILPKKKKKIFHYSVGIAANATGTTLGLQTGKADVTSNRQEKWHSKASFAAGITQDFLFLNRIAISNSILYAQTGFKIQSPNAPADSQAFTKNYSSAISELQIPIGIKGYPVVKKHFRFYVAAGIINHIKLQEVFTVEKETYPTIPSNIVNVENSFVSTQDNPFSGVENKSMNLMDASYMKQEQAEYFGVGGLKRYYASFYASAGVEFIAKRHFVFFAEPMFAMTLKKIGLQDNRKYNVGATGGFRYQF